MTIEDYEKVYQLWLSCIGMGLNNLDDSKDGIAIYLDRNPDTCFVAEKSDEIIGVIISGFVEVLKIKPYMIQNLSIASFSLFFINENWKMNLKGRIAQIATGEGKSIISAILALVSSLQGYFTDIKIQFTKNLENVSQEEKLSLFANRLEEKDIVQEKDGIY